MTHKTKWLLFAPLGLATIGAGASMVHWAGSLKDRKVPALQWLAAGTAALAVLNAGKPGRPAFPRFAHLPLIHGPDGGKLSKRHGATSVLDFQQQGILPEAMCNVLLRLGWGHGDAEVLDRDGMVRLFDMDGVGKSAARLDPAKVANLSAVWLRRADDGRLTQAVVQRLQDGGLPVDATAAARIYALMPGLKERAKTLVDLSDSAAFLARAIPLTFETKALEQLTPEAKAALPPLAEALAATDFTAPALDAALRAHAEQAGRKLGQVAQPLRAALTGSMTSPPIDLTLAALGRRA